MAKIKEENTKTVYVPRRSRGDTEGLYVGVNGRRFLVKRGEPVEVPAIVAEVIETSQAQDKKNDEYIASVVFTDEK